MLVAVDATSAISVTRTKQNRRVAQVGLAWIFAIFPMVCPTHGAVSIKLRVVQACFGLVSLRGSIIGMGRLFPARGVRCQATCFGAFRVDNLDLFAFGHPMTPQTQTKRTLVNLFMVSTWTACTSMFNLGLSIGGWMLAQW